MATWPGIRIKEGDQQERNIAGSTIRSYPDRAQKAGLSWPLPTELDETDLGCLLFVPEERAGIHGGQPRGEGTSIASSAIITDSGLPN